MSSHESSQEKKDSKEALRDAEAKALNKPSFGKRARRWARNMILTTTIAAGLGGISYVAIENEPARAFDKNYNQGVTVTTGDKDAAHHHKNIKKPGPGSRAGHQKEHGGAAQNLEHHQQ